MATRRRSVEVFSLSFLDCICCGFGAVILFYTLISAQSGMQRARSTDALATRVTRLADELRAGTENLAALRNTVAKTDTETANAASRARELIAALRAQALQKSAYDETSLARRERIEKLTADVKALEEGVRRLEGGAVDRGPLGQEIQAFRKVGGDRRYITGIKMHGKRVLILLDRSASMLHQDLRSVLALRSSNDLNKRAALKWRHAVDTANWLLTQLPPDARFQVYAFNTKSQPVLASSGGTWQNANDPRIRARTVEALNTLVAQDGTSLINAFAASKNLSPLPDQIILITDGLPTQGSSPGSRPSVDADARAALFDGAIGELPDGVPLDIVLLPMKGDLAAARKFWQLADATHGTLLMPSSDWP